MAGTRTVAQAVVGGLLAEGVETIFGIAGSHVLAIYAVLRGTPQIRHVTARHENGAALMAEMYARITGRPGVVLVTAGPGATNSLTGIARAYASETPIVQITGAVPRNAPKESFHGLDSPTFLRTAFAEVTKWSVRVEEPAEVPGVIAEAFRVAQAGRPGPVHVEIPIDLFMGGAQALPEYVRREPEPRAVDEATLAAMADLIRRSERPLIAAGKGVLSARAEGELGRLSRHLSAPVLFPNRDGWGVIGGDHPFFAGWYSTMDVFDNPYPNRLLGRADLILTVGEREGTDPTRAVHANARGPVIAINTEDDPEAYDKRATIGVVADARLALAGLLRHLAGDARPHNGSLAASLRHYGEGLRRAIYDQVEREAARAGELHIGQFLEQLEPLIDEETIIVGDVGHHDVWSRILLPVRNRDTYKPEGVWGQMGYALPAAIGAKIAAPGKRVIALTGDGCFLMAMNDFGTALEQGTPIVCAILNDAQYGMMWNMLEQRFGGAYECDVRPPDFVAFARSFGADGERVESVAAMRPAIERAFAAGVPYILDVRIGFKFPYPDYAAALEELDRSAPEVTW
jgi:acetolactate synthase-1/2/3 large subunit